MEPEHDNMGHATLENRISVHATKTITDAEANFEEAWKREVQTYHKEVKQRVRRLDIAIIYATICCLATFISLRLDRCLGFIGRCNDIRAGSDVELIETWCLVVFLSILSVASVTRWSQGTATRSISPELRSHIEQLSVASTGRSASWMDKIVYFVPYGSFLLFLYEVLDNLPLNTPTFSMNVFWSVSLLTILLALPDLQRRPPSTTLASIQDQASLLLPTEDHKHTRGHSRTHSNGEPITDYDAQEPLFMSALRQEQSPLKAERIQWMLDRPLDDETTSVVLRAILRMAWCSENHSHLLKRCYEILLRSFEIVDGQPTLIPRLRNLAYLSARAFCHIFIQSGSDAQGNDKVMTSLREQHIGLSLGYHENDSNLQSVLGLTDRLLGIDHDIEWASFQLSSAHHLWVGDILLHHGCNLVAAGKQQKVYDEIAAFVQDTFSLEPPASLSIDTNCVLMIGLLVDIPVHPDDLLVSGEKKSPRFTPITERLFAKLSSTIQNRTSTEAEINGVLDALRCIGLLTYNIVPRRCFELFITVMTTAFHLPSDLKWDAARLTMHGAFKWDGYYPMVSGPQEVLSFLEHHFDLQAKGENQEEAIQYALRALAFGSSPTCLDALAQFDPTVNPFFDGIRSLFHPDKPHELKKAALCFLSHIEARWFPVFSEHVPPDAVQDFCEDLVTVINEVFIADELEIKRAATTVLLSMADASPFRLHIPLHMWEHLEFVHELREGSNPLRRCKENPDIIPALRRTKDQKPLLFWLAVLWREITKLDSKVQEQVVDATTRAVTQSPHVEDFLLLLLNAEETRLEEKLRPFSSWSTDEEVEILRLKLYELRESRTHFYEVCEPEGTQ